jgi:hypothetical protein
LERIVLIPLREDALEDGPPGSQKLEPEIRTRKSALGELGALGASHPVDATRWKKISRRARQARRELIFIARSRAARCRRR